MNFDMSDKQKEWLNRVQSFMNDACPSRGADLRQAGCGGPALEGDPDPRGSEEEGEGRRPLEHVHAAERA